MEKHIELTWSQAVEKAIIELGYIATLKQIYAVAPKYKNFEGLTPHKTIMADSKIYFRSKMGVKPLIPGSSRASP